MKKILGLLLCMGMFLAGLSAACGSPPGDAGGQYETIVGIADAPAVEVKCTADIEALTPVLYQVAQQTSLDLRADLSRVTASPFDSMIAGLRSNAAELIKETPVHRWRDYPNRCSGVPTNKISRPGWKGKVSEADVG